MADKPCSATPVQKRARLTDLSHVIPAAQLPEGDPPSVEYHHRASVPPSKVESPSSSTANILAPSCTLPPEGAAPESEITVVIPVRDGSLHVRECLKSIQSQTFPGTLLVAVYDDASKDETLAVVRESLCELRAARSTFSTLLVCGKQPRGPGYARNYLISHSRSDFLAFQDADDVAAPARFATQLAAAQAHPKAIVGSRVFRIPADAQPRWTEWYNGLNETQLMLQRFKEVTVINPTWFMDRRVFVSAGGYNESFPFFPEDMALFYAHIERGGPILRLPEDCLFVCLSLSVSISRNCWAIDSTRVLRATRFIAIRSETPV